MEILSNFLKCRQGDKESLVDYLSRFKSERNVVYRILGTGFLDGLARNSKDWDDTWTDEEKKVFKAKELKKFVTVLFLRNSDHSAYSELLVDYRKMFANKQDLYPKTLEDMVDVMRQITPKKKKAEKSRSGNGNGNNNSDKNSEIEASNAQTTKGNQSGDGKGDACYCCGDKECRLWRCEKKDKIAHKDWYKPEFAPKAGDGKSEKVENHTCIAEDSRDTIIETSCAQKVRFDDNIPEPEIFDSGSTITMSKCGGKMSNIRRVEKNVVMLTNAGQKSLDREGDWKEWGQAYLDPTALTNIVSVLDAVRKGFRVLFDSSKANCFFVTNPKDGSVIKFPMKKGLYIRDDTKEVTDVNWTSIEGFTQRQIERAQAARKLYHDLNAENVGNVKFFIRSNQAKNVDISTEDMNLAEKVFGLDVSNTKGKWAKERPKAVSNEDFIELPPELEVAGKEMELAIDVVYINRECFLHTVDRTIKEPSCVTLGTYSKGEAPTSEILYKGLDEIIRKYNRADVRISVIHADNEFRSLLESLIQNDDYDVDINFSNPGEHVPDSREETGHLRKGFVCNTTAYLSMRSQK